MINIPKVFQHLAVFRFGAHLLMYSRYTARVLTSRAYPDIEILWVCARFVFQRLAMLCSATFVLFCFLLPLPAIAWDQGIYLTQPTLEDTERLNYLIRRSKAVGINTFVVDSERISKKYDENIALVKANNLKYIARVVIFPTGGTEAVVRNPAYWARRYRFAEHAIALGADAIQLDYIRYNTRRSAAPRYTQDIYRVIRWFKERVSAHNVPLQIDVFGETCFIPSKHIGQDLTVFADTVDAVNPMVYPSHYWPFQKHSAQPYQTILDSLYALDDQFDGKIPFKVHAFIETYNYHYPMSPAATQHYISQELKAVKDSNITTGWYAWSAHNQYDNLFKVLANQHNSAVASDPPKASNPPKRLLFYGLTPAS